MKKNKWISTLVLLPLSKIYGIVVGVRNTMFDWGILKQKEFDVPIVSVGNIAVGGTGKTPHTEYVVEALRYSFHIGVLSRGYKRKTKGFVLASKNTSPSDIGDESYQIYQKYGNDVTVAVCEDRCEGISKLLEIDERINLIILDDAFQHRYVKSKVSIVLTEYNRPVFMDKMLPLGRLREPMHALNRADMVVVTKCPDGLKPIKYTIFKKNLGLMAYQKVFFSKYEYCHLQPLYPEEVQEIPYLEWLSERDVVYAVSGIDNPRPFVKYLKGFKSKIKLEIFPDHHNFTRKDIQKIEERFNSFKAVNKYIITTEKDAVRIVNNPYFPHHLKSKIFYLPLKVQFVQQDNMNFESHLRKLIAEK